MQRTNKTTDLPFLNGDRTQGTRRLVVGSLVTLVLMSCGGNEGAVRSEVLPPQTTVDGAIAPPDASTPVAMKPIRIVFDSHIDPLEGTSSLDSRRSMTRNLIKSANWLVDTFIPQGVKISFLMGGDFAEMCVDEQLSAECLPMIETLYASGGSVGTHSHTHIRDSAYTWSKINGRTASYTDAQRLWSDHVGWVNTAIRQALGRAADADVSDVNNVRGTHVPYYRDDFRNLMEENGFPIQQAEGGGTEDGEERFYSYFSHFIWNPFRPAVSPGTKEDLTTPYIVSSGGNLGNVGTHKGMSIDFSLEHAKTMFLSLLVNWLERERKGGDDRVWIFGWGGHPSDYSQGSTARDVLTGFVTWLNENFIGKTTAQGNTIAVWSSYADVSSVYNEWEAQNPGKSSFNYDATSRDLSKYPYLRTVNELLRDAYYEEALSGVPEGVTAHRFSLGTRPYVMAWTTGTTATVDLSSVLASRVRVTAVSSGTTTEVASNVVAVGQEPVIACATADCDAAIDGGSSASDAGSDAGVVVDGGITTRPDGGLGGGRDGGVGGRDAGVADAGTSACATTCGSGQVCCSSGACSGRCIPDCRVTTTCPSNRPTCNASTGLCG